MSTSSPLDPITQQEHSAHHAHLQALSVDKLRHEESHWREDLQSGGNPRTTTPTEGEDAMTDEEGEGVDGEGAVTTDWREEQWNGQCEQAQETSRLQKKGKNTKQHTCHSAVGAHTA